MFGFAKKNNSSAEALHDLGTRADKLALEKKTDDAMAIYEQIIERMKSSGEVDAYFLGKSVLGELVALVLAGEIEKAFALWTIDDDSLHQAGVMVLENHADQFHSDDIAVFRMICAYFHAFSQSEKPDSVIHYLNMVNQYVLEHQPSWKSYIANLWYLNLLIYCGFAEPAPFKILLAQIYTKFGAADEARIKALITSSANIRSFNQKAVGGYFPSLRNWEK